MSGFQRIPQPTNVIDVVTREYLNQLLRTLTSIFTDITLNLEQALRPSNFVIVDSASYSITNQDEIILCDTSINAITVNLAPASQYAKKSLTVKKTTADANSVTIDASGSEFIDGAFTYTISGGSRGNVTLYSDGSNWWIIS